MYLTYLISTLRLMFLRKVLRTFAINLQEHLENNALEHSINPDIFLALRTFLKRSNGTFLTFHGNVQGRYCAMGEVTTTVSLTQTFRKICTQIYSSWFIIITQANLIIFLMRISFSQSYSKFERYILITTLALRALCS